MGSRYLIVECADAVFRDAGSMLRPSPIAEGSESTTAAREQKITPFDVEGAVDAEGKDLGM